MAETGLAPTTIGPALERLAKDLGLSERAIAAVLGVSAGQIEEWRSGRATPEGEAAVRFEQLAALHRHLLETFETADAIPRYLRGPLPSLEGRSPLDALFAGEIDRVEGALEALDAGIFV